MLTKVLEIEGHSGAIYSGMMINDTLFTAGADSYLVAWDYKIGKQLPFVVKNDVAIYSIQQIHNNFILLGDANGGFHIIDYAQKKEVKNYKQHRTSIFKIQVNNFRNHIYVSDSEGNVSVWSGENFNLLLFLPLAIGKIRSLELLNNGEILAIGAQDGYVRLFDTENFNEKSKNYIHVDGVTSMLQMTEDLIFSGGKDAYLRLLNQDLSIKKAIPAHNYAIYDIISINNGKHFLTASRDKSIKLWESKNQNFIQKITSKEGGHRHSVNKLVELSETTFASMGDDKRIIIWNINT